MLNATWEKSHQTQETWSHFYVGSFSHHNMSSFCCIFFKRKMYIPWAVSHPEKIWGHCFQLGSGLLTSIPAKFY